MGYRSDVTIAMYPKKEEDYAMLKLFVDENLPDKFEEHMRYGNEVHEVFRYLLLELESIKWYGDYPEVAVYTSTFLDWEERFKDKRGNNWDDPSAPLFHFEFVRLGENFDDITHETSAYAKGILNLERKVHIEI